MNRALIVLMVTAAVLAWLTPVPARAVRLEPIPPDAECAECGMSIADPRFAARMTVVGEGATRTLFFDDAGCAFDYERWHPALVVRTRAFAVSDEPRWQASDVAAFVVNPKIATPMGSGLLAVDAAEAARRRKLGERLEPHVGAAAYRQQWMESRFGTPKP